MRDADDPGLDESTQPVPSAAERGGLGRLGEPLGARVQCSTTGPFAVAAVTWRDAHGRLLCTLVAKVSYELAPGVCAPTPEPIPIQAEDEPWDEDPAQSIRVPGDVAPFKAAAEVVVVGSAYAPSERPVQSVTARVIVGSVDKAVVAWSPRRLRADGGVEELSRRTRFPLRWEHAAGGADTDNPAGIDPRVADTRGRRPIPEILPVGFELGPPGELIPAAGLGPIGAAWRPRRGFLGEADAAWLRGPREARLPPSFPSRFFQAAPVDQWLDRPLAANERLVLEGLHDSIPRLVTSLAGVEPWAVVGASGDPLRLTGDLLFIDTDRTLATLTFRGQVQLDEAAGRARVVILGVPMGAPPSAEAVRRARDATEQLRLSVPPTPRAAPEPDLDDWSETTNVELSTGGSQGPTLPFTQAAVPPPRPSYPDGALPFRAHTASPPLAPSAVPVAPSAVPMALPMVQLAPSVAPVAPFTVPVAPSVAPVAPFTVPVAPSAALGGLRAVSDAAAHAGHAAEKKRVTGGAPDKPQAPRRLAVVDLLFFEPRVVPRVRAGTRFAPLWAQAPRPRVQSVDEARREPPDRADVLRVLCFGRPASASEIRRALADGLDDPTDLEPPLVLVGGELRPTLDETETLRTSVAVAQPVAGSDKKVLAAIALANEALANAIGPRPDTAIGLARQIEANTAALSLPPRYVATQVERALLEGRKLKRRTLLGAPRIRADLALGGETLPMYLPDSVAGSLPLLPAFPIVALCEVRPREDGGEAQAEALFAVALGRVLCARSG